MTPELIEHFHRLEHKVDLILEFIRFKYEFDARSFDNDWICPVCTKEVELKFNKQGQVTRSCGCSLPVKSIDTEQFKQIQKETNARK
jgi:hypothetical protein